MLLRLDDFDVKFKVNAIRSLLFCTTTYSSAPDLLRFGASARTVVLSEKNARSKTSAPVMSVEMAVCPPSFVEGTQTCLMDRSCPCSIDIGWMTSQRTVSPSQRQVRLNQYLFRQSTSQQSSSKRSSSQSPSRRPVLESLVVFAVDAGSFDSLGCPPPSQRAVSLGQQAAPLLSCGNHSNGTSLAIVKLACLVCQSAGVLRSIGLIHACSPSLSEKSLCFVL